MKQYAPRTPALLMLLMAAVVGAVSSAQAESARQCVSGEYVVTVSPVYQLKQKTIEEVASASDEPIVVHRESPRALLLKQIGTGEAFGNGATRRTSAESAHTLCSDLRAGKRNKKRVGRHNKKNPIIRNISCSCNAILKAYATPNDTYYSLEWGLHQANNIDIDAPEAWDISTGTRNVVVAVIDTGIEYNHPDLNPNMWRNPGEIPGNGIDDDANGYIDDVYGINSINNSGDPQDDNGHGTHCAGIIGGVGNNATGVAGVNWNVSMMAVKFLGATGGGNLYDAIESIDYVTMMKQRYGVNVVVTNNSWGSQGETWGPLGDAIMRHEAAGILFVAAAGNDSLNIDVTASSPAGHGANSIVSVAAVDSNGALASFSNYGATKVDVGAPGVSIASTYKGLTYMYLSGTSMAAPMVSGAAALMSAVNPGLTWQNIKQLMMTTGKSLSALNGKTVTGKMINLNQLISAAVQVPVVTPTPSPSPTITPTPRPTSTPTPTPTPTSTPTLVPGYWNVTGTVTGNGTVLTNAVVRLTSGQNSYTRLTDSSGRYSFSSIFTSSSITVSVEAAGFTFQPVTTSLQTNRSIDFSSSSQQFVLSARVINQAGNGLSNFAVDAGSAGSFITDAQGYIRISLPYASSYKLRAGSATGWIINDPERSGTLFGATERVWVAQPN